MKSLEDYTAVEILDMYKTIIGCDLEKIITTLLYEGEPNNEFIQLIDKTSNGNEKNRVKFAYEEITDMLKASPETNNDEILKRALLSEIYRRFISKMPQREKKRIEDLILEDGFYGIYPYHSENYRGIKEYEIITREKQEKVKSIHDNDTRQLMQLLIETVVGTHQIEEVIKAEYGVGVYNLILEKAYIKIFLDKKRMEPSEFKQKMENDELAQMVMQDEELNQELEETLSEYFCNNLQFLDKRILIMNPAARIVLGIKVYKGEKIENVELEKTSEEASEKGSIEFLRKLYAEMKKRNYTNDYSIFSDDGEEIIRIDMEYLEDFLSRCTQSRYLTQNEIENIHSEILEGHFTADLEERRIAGINIEDLINSNNGYEMEEDELKKEEKLKCSIDVAEYLISERNITEEELIEMFLKGEFNIELVSGVNMEGPADEYYSNKFKELYYEMVFSKEPEKVKETIKRFSSLYTQLAENDKVNIDLDELIGEITATLGYEFASEILSDLYEFNIITLEKGIDWVGADILYEEYKKGKLKPGEVREFYENDMIDLPGIAKVINKLQDNGEKFIIIGSIFPEETEEDRATRELLFEECLGIDKGIKSNSTGEKRDRIVDPTGDYYKHITDPFARIGLIKALDEDYVFEMTQDGHAIVRLPNLNKVIIEKMLDENREPSYGVATYILDEEYYNTNEFRIMKDGKVDRQELRKETNPEKVTRILHFVEKWGNNMKDYFSNSANWDERQEAIIDEAIKRVKRSDPVMIEKKKLAEKIIELVVTRNATLDQIKQIAEDCGGVKLDKVMNLYDELFNGR